MKRSHVFFASSMLMLALAVFPAARLFNGGTGGEAIAAPIRLPGDRGLEAELQRALKARYDEAQEEMKIAVRSCLDSDSFAQPGTEKGFMEVVRRCLRATLDYTEGDPGLRLELLEPLQLATRRAEACVAELVATQVRSTDCLPYVRGACLEVEIEVLKAKRSNFQRRF
jgi:hypothetical protein